MEDKMSSDNGTYILQTYGPEYRVMHMQAIDNIYGTYIPESGKYVPNSKSIGLLGPSGSGKTTFAKELAELLNMGFADIDELIEKNEGKSISTIFSVNGESYFRKKETEVLRSTTTLNNTVIAAGGGLPCHDGNMDWMNENGLTVYLKLFDGELAERLLPEQSSRPLIAHLTSEELNSFVYNTLRERVYYYHKAQVVICPVFFTPGHLASMITEENI